MTSRMIAVLVLLLVMLSTNAQAYGILPDPTPEPEPTVEPSPTAEPVADPEPTPSPEATVVPDPTPPPTDESIPIPESIIRKALKPRAASLNLASATEQEKLDMLESNMDSIAVSLAFVQKAKGYDISGVLGLIAQIRENIDALTTKQLDALVTATGDIDNEIVMAIFGGTITQQDIDRMAGQLANAMKQSEDVSNIGGTAIDNTTVLMALGFIAGVLLAQITVKGFDG